MNPPTHAQWLKRFTDWSEGDVAKRAMKRNWFVIYIADVGPGAAMAEGLHGKIILPDLQLIDPTGFRGARFVEVKAKTTGAYKFQKTGQYCTGTDLYKLEAYRKIDAAGIPVDLAIIHLKHRQSDTEYNPYLLWASISTLPEPMTFQDPNNPKKQIAVWDVTDGTGPFQQLGYMQAPQDVLDGASLLKRKVHPWNQPPKLRQPRELPQLQLDL
jgi:hypothetical protein